MGKFDIYKVDLKNMREDVRKYEYLLDNQYFINIDGEDVQKGKIAAEVVVTKRKDYYEFDFHLAGNVFVPCDRCLDDVEIPVETDEHLVVKLGKDYDEESDETVVIPETEGAINLAWFLYEFIALAVPSKHVHAPGKCNRQMSAKLKKHAVRSNDDDDDDTSSDDTDSETEEEEIN